MRRLLLALAAGLAVSCGGGSGGPAPADGQVVGRVLNVETGGPLNPAGTVQVGSRSATTSPEDGSFVVGAPRGATSLVVDTNGPAGVWTFGIPPVQGTVDAGDLWVGPERVQVRGQVRDASTGLPIAGALVRFAGRAAATDANGDFALTDVAYSSATQTAFWGIVGTVVAPGYFLAEFTAAPATAQAGVVLLEDLLLTPASDDDPPPLPFNVAGRVLPTEEAAGTLVTLRDSGGTPVRVFNVGTSGTYNFWVPVGNYTVEFQNGARTAPAQSVTVVEQDQLVQVPDVTLGG